MGTTSDRNDPALTYGVDEEPTEMAEKYLVLPQDQPRLAYARPYRDSYIHVTCGTVTWMGPAIAKTYQIDHTYYGATWCVKCSKHRPVGENGEFIWDDGSGEKVGT